MGLCCSDAGRCRLEGGDLASPLLMALHTPAPLPGPLPAAVGRRGVPPWRVHVAGGCCWLSPCAGHFSAACSGFPLPPSLFWGRGLGAEEGGGLSSVPAVADGSLAPKGKQQYSELAGGERSQKHLPEDAFSGCISIEAERAGDKTCCWPGGGKPGTGEILKTGNKEKGAVCRTTDTEETLAAGRSGPRGLSSALPCRSPVL